MTKLEEIMSRCKCSVCLEVNEHRDIYQTAEEYLTEQSENMDTEMWEWVIGSEEIKQKMIETDTVIYIRFYPKTPNGFYAFYHYDLDILLDSAIEALNDDDKRRKEERRIAALPKITDYNTVDEFLIACALHNRKLNKGE